MWTCSRNQYHGIGYRRLKRACPSRCRPNDPTRAGDNCSHRTVLWCFPTDCTVSTDKKRRLTGFGLLWYHMRANISRRRRKVTKDKKQKCTTTFSKVSSGPFFFFRTTYHPSFANASLYCRASSMLTVPSAHHRRARPRPVHDGVRALDGGGGNVHAESAPQHTKTSLFPKPGL